MVVDCNRLSDDPMHVKAIIQRRTWRFSPSRRHHRKQFLPWLLRPLFEWWQLGDVNPVRWNSYTDLHLNFAKKRFKISLFKSAIWGICCKPSSQVHSDWRRFLHMLIERRCMFGFARPENPSLFSFHCFRLIRFFPWSYILQYWKFNRCSAPTKMPSYFQFFTSLTCNEEPQTRYMGTTLTLKRGIANSIWPLWTQDILETTCAPLWIFFTFLV